MIIADVHCHLDFFDDLQIDEILKRAGENNVKAAITNGVDQKSNRKALVLSQKYKMVKAALGLHPEFIEKFDDKTIKEEINFIREHKKEIVAVGEIGLDYHWVKDETLRKRQRELFLMQLEFAKEIKKPVIVHSRDSESECIEILSSSGIKNVLMHCFSGGMNLVKECYEKGFMFSIPTNIVKSSHFQKAAEILPLSRILTETDAPFLSPYPGKKNEPSFIAETIRKIAEIKKMDPEEVSNAIFSNYQKMFL
ncbi:MAG: TatD family hydrolase [Candidatus Woesearchaeota archaeon]|nr:TatD family hydrolase [Candidatus Woesearchaeota archaeon]